MSPRGTARPPRRAGPRASGHGGGAGTPRSRARARPCPSAALADRELERVRRRQRRQRERQGGRERAAEPRCMGHDVLPLQGRGSVMPPSRPTSALAPIASTNRIKSSAYMRGMSKVGAAPAGRSWSPSVRCGRGSRGRRGSAPGRSGACRPPSRARRGRSTRACRAPPSSPARCRTA